MSATPAPDRIDAAALARLAGLSRRGVQKLAIEGAIPSAAKVGRKWTFDRARVIAWMRELENATQAEAWRRKHAEDPANATFTKILAPGSGTSARKLAGATSDAAYERAIGRKRSSV